MRMAKGRELSVSDDWKQFKMLYDSMELPTGQVSKATTNISRNSAAGDSIRVRDKDFDTSVRAC